MNDYIVANEGVGRLDSSFVKFNQRCLSQLVHDLQLVLFHHLRHQVEGSLVKKLKFELPFFPFAADYF